MYSEIKSAGMRHFLLALVAAFVMYIAAAVIGFFTQSVPMVWHIVTILFFGILVYFVYFHYASVFEYKAGGYKLIISRKTGHRMRVIELKPSEITAVSRIKPNGVKAERMTLEIFAPKNPLYITYGDKTVLIDAGEELYNHIKNLTNGEKE